MEILLNYLSSLHPYVNYALMGLGSLVVIGQSYVWATPTKVDDAWYSRLESVPVLGAFIKAVVSFAPMQRK